jgi:hypothetical protein
MVLDLGTWSQVDSIDVATTFFPLTITQIDVVSDKREWNRKIKRLGEEDEDKGAEEGPIDCYPGCRQVNIY